MTDVHSPETRSRNMAAIGAKDTSPEVRLRKALHALGFRYRLHSSKVPGRPDLVLPKYRVAVFVHGCFWHGHDCPLFHWPATRPEFWKTKIQRNRERDAEVKQEVLATGWRHLTVWECAFGGGGEDTLMRTAGQAGRWLQRASPRTGEIRGARAR